MADHLGNDSPALHGGAPGSGSGRRVRASAVQARKNVLSYQQQENMSLAVRIVLACGLRLGIPHAGGPAGALVMALLP
jgi:hypothetical protein